MGGGVDMVSVDRDTGVVGGPASAFLNGTDGCVDFAGEVAFCVMSPSVPAGDVAIGVVSLAIAGAVSLADLAGDVAVGVASPAVAGAGFLADHAGDIAVGVALPAISGAGSLADLASDVAIGVALPAVAGPGVVGGPASEWYRWVRGLLGRLVLV